MDDLQKEVLRAILKAKVQYSFFSTQQIMEIYNKDKIEKEHMNAYQIGRIIAGMGFQSYNYSGKKRGWRWSQKLVERLVSRLNRTKVK
jgi:hypothetical protein